MDFLESSVVDDFLQVNFTSTCGTLQPSIGLITICLVLLDGLVGDFGETFCTSVVTAGYSYARVLNSVVTYRALNKVSITTTKGEERAYIKSFRSQ
jgi:hypothetical protein